MTDTLRMIQLPENPGVLRDTATGSNYHFNDVVEAQAMADIVNGLEKKLNNAYAIMESPHKEINYNG